MFPKHVLTKKVFFISFFLCTSLVSACDGNTISSQQAPVRASANQQVLINPVSGTSDIKTFDPALASDISSISAIDMVFTGLVSLNDQLKVQDQLAASHDVSADGLTYTFHLRPNTKFSDGTPLTAHDVVYSIDRALQPRLNSSTALYYMGLIKDADKLNAGKIRTIIGDSLLVPDERTVVIKITQKAAYFLDALTYPCAYVVEKSFMDRYGTGFADHLSSGAGSSGPFIVTPNNPKSLQMWKVDWIGDYPDPQDWMSLQFARGAPNNQINYGQNSGFYMPEQQQVQQLLQRADGEMDVTKCIQMYNQAEQSLSNDVAWLPIYQVIATSVRQPCVVGMVDNSQNLTPANDWGSIYISTATPCANPAI